MELVLFIGIQASGKSSFYKERFYRTHLRVNYDMLRNRRREALIVSACLQGRTRFVVDKTNLTRADRARYIAPAREAGFTVTGYYFQSEPRDAIRRNSRRPEAERVPVPGIFGANRRLEVPSRAEGFDRLYVVRLTEERGFAVEEWHDAAPPLLEPQALSLEPTKASGGEGS
jgi:hypothetical protein